MPKNEDGEFELILGNRQLLSVFFIVVVLLGVFFTMGYIVGRSSGPAAGADVVAARKPEVKPLVVESAARDTPPAPQQTVSTAPQKPPEPVKSERPAPAPSDDQPTAGQTYLQLVATAKDQADLYIDVLRKNGFKAFASEVPDKPGLFRVLVGPVQEGELNKIRAELQSKSFPGNSAIKKTF